MFARNRSRELLLRPMTHEDIETVRDVGQVAWSDLAMHDIGRKFRYPKRSEKIIDAYIAKDPEGCIVAERDGKIIGSAFSHTWGKVGWIGPLEVLPSHQGSGVGKALLRGCEMYLERSGCQVIGLETMAHLPKQLHFYMSSGYTPKNLTMIMEKVLRREAEPEGVEEARSQDMDSIVKGIAKLSARVNPLLDYSLEAKVIVEKRLGNVFLSREGDQLVGAALLHTYQRGEEAPYSSIKAVVVDPQVPNGEDIFHRLMERCEQTSLTMGKNRLLARFSTDHPVLYPTMIQRDFSLKGANVRMVRNGQYRESGSYHISSWAG